MDDMFNQMDDSLNQHQDTHSDIGREHEEFMRSDNDLNIQNTQMFFNESQERMADTNKGKPTKEEKDLQEVLMAQVTSIFKGSDFIFRLFKYTVLTVVGVFVAFTVFYILLLVVYHAL